ncbi:MAG TPA: M48 family metallopeptidase [Thermoanaerobaculia bacterium]
MNRQTRGAARPLLAMMLTLSLVAGVAEAQTKVNPGFNMFSPQQDVEIGYQSAVEAERQLPVMNDREINEYVNRIGQRLAANAGGPGFKYQFRVVNASDINAFALPGGFIYINRGIIENARNEGEIAGVLAHEIAHSSLRHGTHQASKAYAAQAGLQILGGLLGGKVGNNTAQILNAVGGVGLNALFLKFSREMETQSDIRGAQILAASGYNPNDMIGFFQQLEKVDKARKTTWTSSHPAPPDRIARIQKERQLLKVPDNATTNVAGLSNIKSKLGSYGRAPSMGEIARSGVRQSDPPMTSSSGNSGVGSVQAPSSSMRAYTDRNGLFRVSYPSNWRVYNSNDGGVTIAPEGGVGTANGRTEVVYGAIISHYDPTQGARMGLRGSTSRNVTLQSATQDLLSQIQSTSRHLRLVRGSEQRFNLDGGNAIAVSLNGNNPNTRIAERVTLVTRQLADGHLLYMVFVTPERDASRYGQTLQAMVSSMQVEEHARH